LLAGRPIEAARVSRAGLGVVGLIVGRGKRLGGRLLDRHDIEPDDAVELGSVIIASSPLATYSVVTRPPRRMERCKRGQSFR
jgi:hypothetical protein